MAAPLGAPEQVAVEPARLVEVADEERVVKRLGQRNVIDASEAARDRPASRHQRLEISKPSSGTRLLIAATEEDRGPVGGGHRGQISLAGSAAAGEPRRQQRLRSLGGAAGVGGLDPYGSDSGRHGSAGVEQYPDISLLP